GRARPRLLPRRPGAGARGAAAAGRPARDRVPLPRRLRAARRDGARPPDDRGACDRAGGGGAGVGRHRPRHARALIDRRRPLRRARRTSRAGARVRDDVLRLSDAFITAVVRCPPPSNRPAPPEIATCRRWLLVELALLPRLGVAVALGKVAHDGFLAAERARGAPLPRPLPRFAHGAEHRLASGLVLLSSYHPSQQNTFTGKLTRPMLDAVFA